MSVVDVRGLREKGIEPSLRTEIWVTHLLGKLAALGRCPHYLQLHACFRSAGAPPDQWACTGGGHSPAGCDAEQDENVPPPGRLRRTARKPARSAGRAGGCYQYVVVQYAEGGDMEEACKALPNMAWPVDQLPHLAFQMLFSLHVAQKELQLRHYDVKLLNFFLTAPAAAVGGPASAASRAACDEVSLRYSVLGSEYLLCLDARSPSLAVLADFGTADISPRTLGAPVAACNFTTLENSPPEFLLCGSAARQGYEADAWGMGLCLLHLLTGRAPYEELLAGVRCPAELRRSLEAVWAGVEPSAGDGPCGVVAKGGGGRGGNGAGAGGTPGQVECAGDYGCVGQVLETDEEGVLADTLYRYLCLFGTETARAGAEERAPGQAPAAGREGVEAAMERAPSGVGATAAGVGRAINGTLAWQAIERWLSSPSGRSRFNKEHAQWSAFHGRAKPIAEAQRRMALLPGAEGMLRGLCEFEPSRRWTVERALGSPMLEPLRAAEAEATAEGRSAARCFTAYA
jgi:serine/threonine protein kinase